MSLRQLPIAVALVLLAGCAATPPQTGTPTTAITAMPTKVVADDNLNAVAWSQTALEHDLIYLQTYRDAAAQLPAALHDSQWDALSTPDRAAPAHGLPPAVVLDIDETVLDNSPYQARLVKSGGEFNEAGWAAWCREARARALPGAVEFTQRAAQHGIAVIYITNRAKSLDEATLTNLRQVGLPVSGPRALLGLGTVVDGCHSAGSDKGCRRQLISRHYRVLMQFGDQLGDFVNVAANTATGRQQAIAAYLPWIGTRWFVLPNPTYGSWEPALFDNQWSVPREQRRQRKIDMLRYQ